MNGILSMNGIQKCHQGSTLRKNFISPAGLVTVNFTSPDIFFASPDINDNFFQIVTFVDYITSVDNMNRICSVFCQTELYYHLGNSRYAEPKEGLILF